MNAILKNEPTGVVALFDDFARAARNLDRQSSIVGGGTSAGVAFDEVLRDFGVDMFIASSGLHRYPVGVSSELLKLRARKLLWKAGWACSAADPGNRTFVVTSELLEHLANLQVTPLRVRASVVGGIGVTIPLHDGYVYVEPRVINDEVEVVAKRVFTDRREPQIAFLDQFDGELKKLAQWAAERAIETID